MPTALLVIGDGLVCEREPGGITFWVPRFRGWRFHPLDSIMVVLSLAIIGFVGAPVELVWGCVNLFHATRLSMLNISEEEAAISQTRSEEAEKQNWASQWR